MKKILLKAFDESDNYTNVIVPLTLNVDEVVYVYHHIIDERYFNNCSKVIRNYSEMTVGYYQIAEEKELDRFFEKAERIIIDVSSYKYLSLVMLEKAFANKSLICYYDNEEDCIKSYRHHEVIRDKMFNLSIDDIVTLNNGEIKDYMHKPPRYDDNESNKIIVDIIEDSLDNYKLFVNYIQRINSYIANKNNDGLTYDIGSYLVERIYNDEAYRKYQQYPLFELTKEQLIFKNRFIARLFMVSGAFLENYLYLKLKATNYFDDVILSAVIDFSSRSDNYPVTCEIDGIVVKDNRSLFISCKSNKVDTECLNEIKLHSLMFGNQLSRAVVVTLDDVDISSPSTYLKAKELGVAIIDRSVFKKNGLVEAIISIFANTYKYDRVY